MFNRIFISYATEDFKYAERLYDFLESNGFQPWMDKKNLLPGQDWDLYIQQELRKADFIVLLLSDISVTKRGYVQKEFRKALIYCEEKLDSDIYIIPILIDSCSVPEKLSKVQWIEYSQKDSFNKILASIQLQQNVLINEKKQKEAKSLELGHIEKEISGHYGNNSPKQLYELKYPLFNNIDVESLYEINVLIEDEIFSYLRKARHNFYEYLDDEGQNEDSATIPDSTLYGRISFQYLSNRFISYTSFWSLYESGAAHGNYWTIGHNFLISPVMDFNISLLFEDFNKALPVLRDIVHEKLMFKAKNEMGINEPTEFYLLEEGLTAEEKNFENFYVKDNSIIFIYNIYNLTPYAAGDHHSEITFDELLVKFPKDEKLIRFIEIITTNKKQTI